MRRAVEWASTNGALDYELLEFLKRGSIRNAEIKSGQQSSSISLQRPPTLDRLYSMPVYNTIPSRRRGGGRGQSIFKKVNGNSFVLNINTAYRNSKDITIKLITIKIKHKLSTDLFSTLFTHMGPIGPCKVHIKSI